jgi:Putative restriction endonuclease
MTAVPKQKRTAAGYLALEAKASYKSEFSNGEMFAMAGARRRIISSRIMGIEILSESTEHYDRTTKFRNYQQLPSFQEHILVEQDEVLIGRYVRQPDDTWNVRAFTDVTAYVTLEIPVADVYRGVTLPRLAEQRS